ncbi:unnamed protein product [Bursaphelenchus okinawaensis]|uniref:Uncharacterized protein n=1 Tax=Bursaphelenchus okinawaensis TaxID=465554 RepID=A0A811K0P0_9BILA|nr:unnamed protein product [Bursaphelenchus okinawaensis]CAG9089354.1 unnamed protein product [Bursaphelenchus okinawaensis]
MPGVNYGTYWFHERPLPIVMYTDIRNFYQKYYFLCATLVVSIAYLLTVYYSYLTYVCLEKNKNAYTAKTLKINKQLSICMLCQVICSLTVGCAPVLVFTIPTFLYADSGISTWICGVILSFVPICNPIVTIIIMKPYRETLLRIVCRRKINNTGSSSFGGVTDTSINTSKI